MCENASCWNALHRISSKQRAMLFLLPEASNQILLTTAAFAPTMQTAQITSDLVISMDTKMDSLLPELAGKKQCMDVHTNEFYSRCLFSHIGDGLAADGISCVPIILAKFLPEYGRGLCREAEENRRALVAAVNVVARLTSGDTECLKACHKKSAIVKAVPINVGDKDGKKDSLWLEVQDFSLWQLEKLLHNFVCGQVRIPG